MADMTLIDLAKRLKDGRFIAIAEVLNKVNEILSDAVWVRSNGETSHTTTKRTSLPTGSWRKINQGVARHRSTTQQIVEPIAMLEDFSVVDEALVDMSPDGKEFRLGEDMAFLEGMSQTLATTLFYGNTVAYPEKFDGFDTRYPNSSYTSVRSNGMTGSNTSSLWLIQWGADKVHLIYPKNSNSVGIGMEDDGKITVEDSSNNRYKAYQTHFKLKAGLVVRDDRCVQRVSCVDPNGGTYKFNADNVVKAAREMPNGGSGAIIYANKTVLAQMDIDVMDKTNVNYSPGNEAYGGPIMMFRGMRVRQVDALLDTEDAA